MRRSRRSESAPRWALQDAKNKLSEVVDAASRGQPQVVTRRGVATAVVMSYEEYQRIRSSHERPPSSFADYLLSIPTEPGLEDLERIDLHERDVVF